MEDTQIAALQKKLDELSATVNRQHAEHFGWLNQMLQQQNNMLSSQVGSLRQEQQSLKRALGITDANMPFEPYYNRSVEMSSREPELYNKYGERMQPIFLSDRNGAHDPYAFMPRYIFFDRYDYALKNHMYTGDEAFRTVGKPINKFAQPGENRAIHPHIYEHYLQNRSYFENEFQYVFTHDDEILNTFSNARLILSYAGLYWYGNQQPKMGNNKIDEHRGGGEKFSLPRITKTRQRTSRSSHRTNACVECISSDRNSQRSAKPSISPTHSDDSTAVRMFRSKCRFSIIASQSRLKISNQDITSLRRSRTASPRRQFRSTSARRRLINSTIPMASSH